MMQTTVPTPGTNKLTERLLAQGVKLEDHKTWPEGVWACEINNFGYSREYRFMPTWESPCGLLIHAHGDMWGETWVNGEFKCAENDNPLFRCPLPGKPCQHRLDLPAGINCQFHRTDREWSEEESVERLYKRYDDMLRRTLDRNKALYPGWNGVCFNLKNVDMPDGSVKQTVSYKVEECIRVGCSSTQCVCRNGAQRDTTKSNIFYDLYIERRFTVGMIPYTDKRMMKGLKVFNKPVARTDAEIALKMWRHDPDSPLVPMALRNKLNAGGQTHMHDMSTEAFFVKHHKYWDGRTDVELFVEIRNIRIGKNEQRDMLQDLMDVQDGIAVKHASDEAKAAKAVKSQERFERKVKKYGRLLADGAARSGKVENMRPDLQKAIRDEAQRILEQRREHEKKESEKGEQITFFDVEVGQ